MAENNPPVVVRPTMLTNSAAEYVENYFDSALGIESPDPLSPEFVPERDKFEKRDGIPRVDYYKESQKKMKEFEETLETFSQTLKKHDIDKKIDVLLKRPYEYTLEDVFLIADKLHQKHKNAADIRSCTGAFLKCFRFIGGNTSGTLQQLLKCVPDDIYGSVISGGFAIILGAAERAESLRQTIYATLEAIPKKLEVVKILSDIHFKTERLHCAVDWVFVSLFKVLDRIVKELSKNMIKKGFAAVVKGDRYGSDVQEALDSLEQRLQDFKEQAQICDSQRLGRIEKNLGRIDKNLAQLVAFQQTHRDCLEEARQEQVTCRQLESEPWSTSENNRPQDVNTKIQKQEAILNVSNSWYTLLTSSEKFDPQTGKARKPDRLEAQTLEEAVVASSRSTTPVRSTPGIEANKKTVKKWLKRLPLDFTKAARSDIGESLHVGHRLDRTGENKVQWIMTSRVLLNWLEETSSGTVLIQGQTAPTTLTNAITFSSAFIADSLQKSYTGSPVLYYSCGLRTEAAPRADDQSGPIALINSLNSQLLHWLRRREGLDLSFLGNRKHYRGKHRAPLRVRPALKLLKRLVDKVPEHNDVFIIVDSLSRLSGDEDEQDKAIEGISSLVNRHMHGVTVKILMTDLLPSHSFRRGGEYEEIVLPDRVESGSHGLNTEFLREVSQHAIGRRHSRLSSDASEVSTESEATDDGSDGSMSEPEEPGDGCD